MRPEQGTGTAGAGRPRALATLPSALAEDLRQALARGNRRDDPSATVSGLAWLTHAAVAALVLGAGLWILADYHAGFARINDAATLWPTGLWQILTILGDERVSFALSLVFARRHPRVFWTLICAGVLALLYARGLKPLVDAPRPPAVLAADSFHLIGPGHQGESFPSGHSITAGVFFGVLLAFARRAAFRVFFLLLAVLAGISRVAVGVHWPVDVACGLGGGWLAAWIGVWMARRSPWGVADGSAHLAFVTLAAIVTVGLWFDDGGYAAAALPLRVLCVVALGTAALGYVILPLWRCLTPGRPR
jgi:membrane-associated phospholipid phosphatase